MSKVLELAKELVSLLEKEETTNKVKLSEIPVGGKFATDIGNFIVLEHSADHTKVITEKLYRENVKFDEDLRNYAESELYDLCEYEILNEFAEVFGLENIIKHEVDLVSVDMQHEFDSVECMVRPLTFDEARQYNDILLSDEIPGWYWTCTPWSTEERGWKYSIAVVAPSGGISNYNFYSSRGVRPVCILKSNIFVSKED